MISNSSVEALKPFLTWYLHVGLPQLSAPGESHSKVGFQTHLNLHWVREGEKTSPLWEEKALCGFPGAFEKAPGAEGMYVLV